MVSVFKPCKKLYIQEVITVLFLVQSVQTTVTVVVLYVQQLLCHNLFRKGVNQERLKLKRCN